MSGVGGREEEEEEEGNSLTAPSLYPLPSRSKFHRVEGGAGRGPTGEAEEGVVCSVMENKRGKRRYVWWGVGEVEVGEEKWVVTGTRKERRGQGDYTYYFALR